MSNVQENLNQVLSQIKNAEKNAFRPQGSVKLLAVSKFHTVEEIKSAIEAGQKSFGENRVQEAFEKFSILNSQYPELDLHIIGQLQTNKVKKAIQIASTIESVDRLDLIKEIEKQCAKINKNIKILFELHTGEESKSGFSSEEELKQAIEYCAQGNCPHVVPFGFMTMAPFTENQDLIRSSFKQLKNIAERMTKEFPMFNFAELSMGMSGDYQIAIEEGSTQVRVGTAIFGERDYSKK